MLIYYFRDNQKNASPKISIYRAGAINNCAALIKNNNYVNFILHRKAT